MLRDDENIFCGDREFESLQEYMVGKIMLADAIRENGAFSASRAEMIARTETAFADVHGNRMFYEEAEAYVGPIKWQWMTANDDKVSLECRMNHGEVRPIGGVFPSGAVEPPQNPRCRCDVLPIVAG